MADQRLTTALEAHDLDAILTAVRGIAEPGGASVADAIRPHLGGLTLQLRDVARLGKALMLLCPRLGPPLTKQPTGLDRTITVLGTSHVRFFGAHALFFPLFIGMGPNMLSLTEASYAETRRKVLDNLVRVDPDSDLILDLGAEPYYHVRNVLGTRPGREADVTPHDEAMMFATASRYRALLSELRDRQRGRLILFNVLPTHDPIGNALSRLLNDHARNMCGQLGVGFLDIWDALIDPSTGTLRRDMAAQAYNDDTHLSEGAIPLVLAELCRLGVIDDAVADVVPACWRHVFGFPVSPGGDTRIWCEADVIPANAFRSEKVAAAFVAGAALEILLPIIVGIPNCRVLMLNVKDGFLPVMLPLGVARRIVGVCDDSRFLDISRRVAAFAGRSDYRLLAGGDPLTPVGGFDLAIVSVHPASIESDMARATALLPDDCVARTYVIGPAGLFNGCEGNPFGVRRFHPLGHHLLAGRWPDYGLFLP